MVDFRAKRAQSIPARRIQPIADAKPTLPTGHEKRRGVRVNAICPGPVTETKMSKDLGLALATRMGIDPDAQLADFLKSILQGRGQTAQEIAAVAAFLASDQASAITGQSVNVDGGAAFC